LVLCRSTRWKYGAALAAVSPVGDIIAMPALTVRALVGFCDANSLSSRALSRPIIADRCAPADWPDGRTQAYEVAVAVSRFAA